jgi:hypothetical protein
MSITLLLTVLNLFNMLIQKEFPFGNPTNESKMITAILFISIIGFAAAEIINLYKDNNVKKQING